MEGFYAAEFSSHKKDDKKSLPPKLAEKPIEQTPKEAEQSKEHVFTKEEVIKDLSANHKFGGFMNRIIPFGMREEAPAEKAEPQVKPSKEEKIQEVAAPVENATPQIASSENIAAPEAEAPVKKVEQDEAAEKFQTSPFAKEQKVPSSKPKEIKAKEEKEIGEANKPEILSPNFKLLEQQEHKEEKKPAKARTIFGRKKAKVEEKRELDAREQELLMLITGAAREFKEEDIENALEKIASYREENEANMDGDSPFNTAIVEGLIKGISTQLAYGSPKRVGDVFQLLDLLGLEVHAGDLLALENKVLKSKELHDVSVKYLLQCAKEFADHPMELERKIEAFAKAGIVSAQEIKEASEFQETIEKNLLGFAKENQKDPLRIERKIYEYSLAGFVDAKKFKQNSKLKELSLKFVTEFLTDHFERSEQVEKKIAEYERAGLITRAQIKAEEKIQTLLEKYLKKYLKENAGHERKSTMKINEFFKMGIMTAQMKEDLLREAK